MAYLGDFDQKKFARLVNSILDVKLKVSKKYRVAILRYSKFPSAKISRQLAKDLIANCECLARTL
jgi:hypothetical protein